MKRIADDSRRLTGSRGLLQQIKDIGQIDPDQVRRYHDLLLGIARQAVAAAKKALVIPLIGLLVAVVAAAGLICYLRAEITPPRWPLLACAALLAIPSAVLLVYSWILVQVFRAPESISQLSDLILQAIHACRSVNLVDDDPTTGTWRRRIRMLSRFGRLALDLRRVVADEKHSRVSGPLQAAALMAVPLFWLGLLGTLVFTAIAAALVPLVCTLHYMLT